MSILDFTYEWNPILRSFVTSSFHSGHGFKVHIVACIISFKQWIISRCMEHCIVFTVSTHELIEIGVVSSFWSLWVMLLWIFAYKSCVYACMWCVHMVFITPGYIPRSRNYWVIQKLCLAFAITRCFSHSSCMLLYYQQQPKRIQLLPTLTNICFCPYLWIYLCIPASVKWYHIMGFLFLFFVFLMTNDVEQFFMCVLLSCTF